MRVISRVCKSLYFKVLCGATEENKPMRDDCKGRKLIKGLKG